MPASCWAWPAVFKWPRPRQVRGWACIPTAFIFKIAGKSPTPSRSNLVCAGITPPCGLRNTAVCRMPTSLRPTRPSADGLAPWNMGQTCNCSFASPYPFSIGPHVGVAWQITPKTVFRAGGAINYAAGADQAGLNVSVPDFLSLGSPGYGLPAAILKNGDPYAPGNVYGNPVLTFSNFYNPSTPQYPAAAAPGVVPPSSPFISIAPNAARLPRIFQWSIGFQREFQRTWSLRQPMWEIAVPGGLRPCCLRRITTASRPRRCNRNTASTFRIPATNSFSHAD